MARNHLPDAFRLRFFFATFVSMKSELSILIPVYNSVCTELVEQLFHQAKAISGLSFEIIVADDGSTERSMIDANRRIEQFDCCRYLVRKVNKGRAAIRNFLAQEASCRWLLFIDCDMTICREDFLCRYLECSSEEVIYGGYTVGKGMESNLRYVYEKDAEPKHTTGERRKNPYRDFHTANFMIRRDLMLNHPFDERFRRYGYEDVLLGKHLRNAHIGIEHIDNPVGFCSFEDNAHFVCKTEEGLRTLYEFRLELRGYNGLLTLVNGIHVPAVRFVLRSLHRLIGSLLRKNLCSNHPNLTVFKFYRLGYYLTLEK